MFLKPNFLQPALLIVFSVALIITSAGCLERHNNYGVEGIPVISDDGKYLVAVIAESEAMTYSENGGFRKTTYSTSYWLKKYETATGKLLQKKGLIFSAEKTNSTATCYGSCDNKIWLYINGLQAYDFSNLQEVVNEEKLAAGNGMKKNIFPYGDRLINPSVENGYIDFIADNGDEYRILLKNLKIINKEDIEQKGRETGRWVSRLLKKDDYGVRCDTFGTAMFALAKDSAAAANCSPVNNSVNEVMYRMRLYKANYSTRQLGNHDSFDYSNITQQGNTTYLNPCFAKDYYSDKAINLLQPAGYLIIHQDVLSSNSKAILTRVDVNNKKIWETATGVSTRIAQCITSGKYCIITANTSYMLSPHVGKDALCIIDTETGTIIQAAIEE